MSAIIFLEAESIYLRPLAPSDLTVEYQQWLNDEETCRYNSHAIFPYSAQQLYDYFAAVNQNTEKAIVLAIVDKASQKHIGNISLQSINWVARSAEFAILLGDRNYWNKGISSTAAALIVDYAFQRLNLHRIYCGTSSDNKAMQKLAEKLKMKQEGVRREAIYKNGHYADIVEYGVLKTEFYK